jgi:hypothetical protein
MTSGEVVPANARGRLARAADAAWIDDHKEHPKHPALGMMSPVTVEEACCAEQEGT